MASEDEIAGLIAKAREIAWYKRSDGLDKVCQELADALEREHRARLVAEGQAAFNARVAQRLASWRDL